MIQKLFVLFDCKSETYTAPTMNPSREQARRSFADAVNNVEGGQPSVLFFHPEDFTLFEVVEYNPATADISVYPKIAVANGVDVKIPK